MCVICVHMDGKIWPSNKCVHSLLYIATGQPTSACCLERRTPWHNHPFRFGPSLVHSSAVASLLIFFNAILPQSAKQGTIFDIQWNQVNCIRWIYHRGMHAKLIFSSKNTNVISSTGFRQKPRVGNCCTSCIASIFIPLPCSAIRLDGKKLCDPSYVEVGVWNQAIA